MQELLLSDPARFRPLLKWPGGKGREWDEIRPSLPRCVRDFADPFMGGGAPFASTPFERRAYLNDRHERLVDIHRFVQRQDSAFLGEIEELGRVWASLENVARDLSPEFARIVNVHRAERQPDARAIVDVASKSMRRVRAPAVADSVAFSVLDKAGRIARLERKHSVSFPRDEVAIHCETAVRAGFYTFVREREQSSTGARGAADFLFLREYCYGSMFRHNADGGFNIPYGGTSYNGKAFLSRLSQYRSEEIQTALGRATFSCEDFETFLDRLRPSLGPQDFVFADPPYDSEFKSYGPVAFARDDHQRLAKALARLPCPWLLVIKETDFVRETYLSGDMRSHGAREAHAFGKKYGYNVRGRNDRATRHLLIANYDRTGDQACDPPLSSSRSRTLSAAVASSRASSSPIAR